MVPAVGRARPAIRRNRVDLPEPDRPRKPTISCSQSSKSMSSSTSRSPPSALGKAWRTSLRCRSGAAAVVITALSQSELAFGIQIKRTPERSVDDDDEQAHHGDPEHDTVEIAGLGGA